ncbi:unnamed protein product, partial [Rotaria magnacalcarata]
FSLEKQHGEILSTYEEIYGVKTSIDVENIFQQCKDQTKKVFILGRAGIGKSTFCQYVTYRWAKGELWSEYKLVILIRLRRLTDSRYPPGKRYSVNHLLENEYFPCDELSHEQIKHFKELCNKGQVFWILDGYDEFAQNIPEQLKDVFDHVRETQHHILTSRPYAIESSYDVKLEITGFTNDNIVKYVQQFFDQITKEINNDSSEIQKLLRLLKKNSSIWGVAHIPVNLELICSLWCNNDWKKTTVLTLTVLYDNIIEWQCRRYVRWVACYSLVNLGDIAATNEVILALLDAARDDDRDVRWRAHEALGKLGEKATTNEVIAALLDALRDDNRNVRGEVCKAFRTLGEKAATNEVITALVNAMRDDNGDVRLEEIE